MIYLECYGDKSLLVGLGASKALLKHSHGRNNVCFAVRENPGSTGLVDEDPEQLPDSYMATLQTSISGPLLKLLIDPVSESRLLVIRSNLEKWVIEIAREVERVEAVQRILNRYYLPRTFRDLHDALNRQGKPNQHFIRMISELKPRSAILQSLIGMLGI